MNPNRRSLHRARLDLLALEDRSVPSTTASVLRADPDSYDADTILVRLKPDAPRVLAAVAAGVEFDHPLLLVDNLWSVRLTGGVGVSAAIAAAKANPFVQYAEPNYLLHVATTPNDPKYTDGTLWGMNQIGMPSAWGVQTDGRAAVVAVIDSGVDYNHPDLATNIWTNTGEIAGDGIDNEGNGFIDDTHGWDFANNDNNPMDDHSHGTHVAGTIGGVGDNGIGVVGVNWAAQIMPLKFLNAQGSGTTEAAISALNYAVRMRAKVSNHSYGGGPFSQANLDALTAAGNAGHLVVAAAGNGDFFGNAVNNDNNPFYPASYQPSPDNVISVAATDSADKFASWSNYGAKSVDLAAPGVNIYSTVLNNGYGYKSGTSMAAPHVAGAAALIWSANPGLTMPQLRSRILSGTDSIAALNPSRPTVSNGRLNVANSIVDTSSWPELRMDDQSVSEGDTGTTDFTFTVSMSAVSADPVTVNWTTSNGTATGGSDYSNGSGTLTFAAGTPTLTQTITIKVIGETQFETNETFFVNLSGATNATLADNQGQGTIVNDDPQPKISVSDFSSAEGNSGNKTFTFTVSLSNPSYQTITVQYATADETAKTSDKDYTAKSGSLTFAAGETSKTITVSVRGDRKLELDETFLVNLSSPTNASFLDWSGVGTILNDDK